MKLSDKPFDFNDPSVIDYLNVQQAKFEANRSKDAEIANTTERSLSGQLMLLNTVLITVSGLFLGNDKILLILSPSQKRIIFLALSLDFLSILLGITHYLLTGKFYQNWADKYNKVVKLLLGHKFKNEKELREKSTDIQHGDTVSVRWPLYSEVLCILASFILYLIVIYKILKI